MGGAPALGGAGAGAAEVEALLREFPALGRTEDGRVKCSLTGHVMHAKPEVVRPYVQGKRFAQASAKARAMDALKQAQGYRLDLYEQALQRLQSQHAGMLDDDLKARLASVKERIKDADVELEAHRLALDAYDKDGFKRGIAILALVGLIVLLVIGTFVRIALV